MKRSLFIVYLLLVTQFLIAQKFPKVEKVTTLTEPINAGSGGMEVDRLGNIYMSNFGELLNQAGGKEIFKISATGQVSLFVNQINGASGSDIGPDGRFYQSNISGNKVSVIDADGTVEDYVSEGLFSPVGLVKTPTDLFVANCGSNTIQRIGSDLHSSIFSKSDLLKCPNGLEIDPGGNLYAANFANGDIVKIDQNGKASVFATLPGNNNGHLVFYRGLLFVVARKANQIWAIDMEGNKTLLAGSGENGNKDGSAEESTFHFPNDLAFSPDHNLIYVNDVLRKSDDGRVLGPVIIRVLHLKW